MPKSPGPPAGASPTSRGSRGSRTTNFDPWPTRLSTSIVPWCMSTIDFTIARPSPEPVLRASFAPDPR